MFDEYIFFNKTLMAEFTAKLELLKIEYHFTGEEDEFLVSVPEDLDDATSEMLEAIYDKLLRAQSDLINAEGGDEIDRVGVLFKRADGSSGQARLDARIIDRVTGAISYEELQSIVQSIADAVAEESVTPLCHP